MDDHRQQLALGVAQHAVRLQVLLDRRIMSILNVRGLSGSELDVLGALAGRGDEGARPRELSARLLLTTGGLSNILRRLQEDGLIERERDALDARSQIIRLTEKGQTTAHETALATTNEISRTLEPVDSSVLEAAAQSLHRVLVAIEEDGPVHRDQDHTA